MGPTSLSVLLSAFILLISGAQATNHNVLMTEVFAIVLEPTLFNWTYEGRRDQFTYEASLANYPDLPSWIHYVFSERHHSGFLYGVPPNENTDVVSLDVVGLNKKTYGTRVENLNIVIQEKLNTARYEVHMKIDNLNVPDMFDVDRMDALKAIFSANLWKDSEDDLYVTLLESAVEMGARKPLNPVEGEGVIVRLGSEATFSTELLELQEEVRPLYKLRSCPRDFKRTSVEILFREAGFALDWCSFRLIHKDVNNSAMHKSDAEFGASEVNWEPRFSRGEVPMRSYKRELVMAITLPMIIMTVLVFALTFILCFEHDDVIGFSDDLAMSGQEQSNSGRFLVPNPSMDREHSISPDILLLSRSHTNSPTSTMSRGVHCRPSPPPYVKPKYKSEI